MEWLRGLFRNPHYKLLSFALALASWLYVQGEQVVEAKVRANLAWMLPEGLVTTEPLPGAIQLTVSGSRAAIRRAERSNVRIEIDLTDASVGEAGLEFASFPVVGLPQNVAVSGYSPSSIRFVLDEVSTRKVKIEPVLVGEPGEGYAVVPPVPVTPPVVTIRGPRRSVGDLLAVNTKPIDVSGLTKDTVRPVELDLSRSVEVIAEEPPKVRIDVEPRLEQRRFSRVEVMAPRGWTTSVDTLTLTVEGPSGELRRLQPDDLVVRIRLPDNPSRDRYEVSFGPQVGPHLAVLGIDREEVRVVSMEPSSVEVTR